jgi:hypothetical protein
MRLPIGLLFIAAFVHPALAQQRTVWEYKAVQRSEVESLAEKGDKNRFEAGLNKLGADGWELVISESPTPLVRDRRTPGRLIFKRIGTKKTAGIPNAGRAGDKAIPYLAQKAAVAPVAPLVSDPRVIPLKNAKADDIAKTLARVFPKEDGILIIPEPRTNSLILKGSAEQMMRVYRLLAELDEKAADNEKPAK